MTFWSSVEFGAPSCIRFSMFGFIKPSSSGSWSSVSTSWWGKEFEYCGYEDY